MTAKKTIPFANRTEPKAGPNLKTWTEAALEEFDSSAMALKRYIAGLLALAGDDCAGLNVTIERDEIESLLTVAYDKAEALRTLIDDRTTNFQEKFGMDDTRGAR